MNHTLVELMQGFSEWSDKVTEIGNFDVPVGKFYEKFYEEAGELSRDRNEGEMIDAINTLFMLYVRSGSKVTLKDCYDKLMQREQRYERGGPKDIRGKCEG